MKIRDHALSLAFAGAFVFAIAGQSVAGLFAYNEEQAAHGAPSSGWLEFVTSSDFVVDVAENWQSELLAVGSMVAFSIFLRQRGSAESKPVGTPHGTSSVESE